MFLGFEKKNGSEGDSGFLFCFFAVDWYLKPVKYVSQIKQPKGPESRFLGIPFVKEKNFEEPSKKNLQTFFLSG